MLSMVLMRFLNLQSLSHCFCMEYTSIIISRDDSTNRWLLARNMTDARYYRIVHEDD